MKPPMRRISARPHSHRTTIPSPCWAPGRARMAAAIACGVEPRRDNKFLYRGEICVNAADFAVESIDAEPAKNPSFWIKKTRIEHRYQKIGQFWLPAFNQTSAASGWAARQR